MNPNTCVFDLISVQLIQKIIKWIYQSESYQEKKTPQISYADYHRVGNVEEASQNYP